MTQQCYIKTKKGYLLSCIHIPQEYNKVVILLQGFSHSMTDIDYFMTNVKNELVNNGYAVVQFDPHGHGDSDGCIEKFDYHQLVDNINIVADWVTSNFKIKPIIITRGLFEIALYNNKLSFLFEKCVVLNPVYISTTEYSIINKYVCNNSCLDFNMWFSDIEECDKEFIEDVFYIFGAKLKNLQGQMIDTAIFKDFAKRTMERNHRIESNAYYLFSNSVSGQTVYNACKFPMQFSARYYLRYGALPRDPEWHFRIISNIVSLCSDKPLIPNSTNG